MRYVPRTNPPDCLNNDVPQVRQGKERLYDTKDPWNGFCTRKTDGVATGRQDVCKELLKMFDEECAFCGKRLYLWNTDTQVDHFLPERLFKLISLSWENMILLCGDCNNKKRKFSPESLNEKIFIEGFMKDSTIVPHGAEVFNKNQVFSCCDDRLIDPSFDDPVEHIRFDPASRQFEVQRSSSMGRLMKEKIFHRAKWLDELLRDLSDEIKGIVENASQPDQEVNARIKLYGHSFFRREFYRYWSEVKKREGVV